MFSTPLISCSSGAATVSATVSADAPEYAALMAIVGGAISGYCDSESCGYANAPIRVMMTAMTDANIGRSMKKRERFTNQALPSSSGRPDACRCRRWCEARSAGLRFRAGHNRQTAELWLDLLTGPRALQAADDNPILW